MNLLVRKKANVVPRKISGKNVTGLSVLPNWRAQIGVSTLGVKRI